MGSEGSAGLPDTASKSRPGDKPAELQGCPSPSEGPRTDGGETGHRPSAGRALTGWRQMWEGTRSTLGWETGGKASPMSDSSLGQARQRGRGSCRTSLPGAALTSGAPSEYAEGGCFLWGVSDVPLTS